MESVKFSSRKDKFFTGLILSVTIGLIALLLGIIFIVGYGIAYIAVLAFCVPALVFFYSIFFRTYYILTDEKLFYRSGPIFGNIPLKSITKVKMGTTTWSGMRPATARKGILVFYNKHDQLYISPYDNELFLNTLINRNSNIEIERDYPD